MDRDALIELLATVPDTREVVIKPAGEPLAVRDPLLAAFRAARAEADAALEHWRAWPGAEAYAVYRAAEDRADAAQDSLADR